MAAPSFAFLHVGEDVQLPELMVASIRKFNPAALITQCTDEKTPAILGVDSVHRHRGDTSQMMAFRTQAFASLPVSAPTLFLDTDMLCFTEVDPAKRLGDSDVGVCRREFALPGGLNTSYMGVDLTEYRNTPWNEVYPYLGCATITRDNRFWADCLQVMSGLDAKFQHWYGDQEALREVVKGGRYRVTELPESLYACLPEEMAAVEEDPLFVHFKGPRKPLMLEMARHLDLEVARGR